MSEMTPATARPARARKKPKLFNSAEEEEKEIKIKKEMQSKNKERRAEKKAEVDNLLAAWKACGIKHGDEFIDTEELQLLTFERMLKCSDESIAFPILQFSTRVDQDGYRFELTFQLPKFLELLEDPRFIRLSKINAEPIAINVVVKERPIQARSGRGYNKLKQSDINPAVKGWSHIKTWRTSSFAIQPESISWSHIHSSVIETVTDGFQPELPEHINVRATCEPMHENGRAGVMLDYIAACARKDEEYELQIRSVWVCTHPIPICIGGDNQVLLPGGIHKLVRNLEVGEEVVVARPRHQEMVATVTAVWKAHVEHQYPMVSINAVLVTADHPVCVNGVDWKRADDVAAAVPTYVDAVYNFALSTGHQLCLCCKDGKYMEVCTMGKPVPGIPDPLWGTNKIFDYIREIPSYPRIETAM